MEIRTQEDGRADKISQRMPWDLHQHVRVGNILRLVVPMVAKRFAGAIIMPNTVPPITTHKQLRDYRAEIIEAALETAQRTNRGFHPLMTLYLTDTLDPKEVELCCDGLGFGGVKYYPRGLTTNSDSGVENPASLWTEETGPYNVLRVLAERRRVLLLHAADGVDTNGNLLDPYDQEEHFLKETLPRILDAHPDLKISVEHLSTGVGAEFMADNGGERLGCSLTPHHLLLDRRDLFKGGFNTHSNWIPILQREEDKLALRELVAKRLPFVYLGSDSAPHPVADKEAACCKGGVLTAHAGIELYAEVFDDMKILDHLEAFSAVNGPTFYGIEPSNRTIELARTPWTVFSNYSFGKDDPTKADKDVDPRETNIRPFRLGETIQWKLVRVS